MKKVTDDGITNVNFSIPLTRPEMLICPKHGEYCGWTIIVNGEKIESECDQCAGEKAEQERLERDAILRARLAESKSREAFNSSCIPPRFASKSFKCYEPHSDETAKAKHILGEYVMNFGRAMENGTSFLFTGGTNTGKTHLACAVGNNIMLKGRTAIYVSVLNYLSKVKKAWSANDGSSEDSEIEKYVSFDLLILDELGKGQLDAKEKGMIFRLIDRRYEENRPTIGISKLSEANLVKLIDDDSVRRLKAGGGRNIYFGEMQYQSASF